MGAPIHITEADFQPGGNAPANPDSPTGRYISALNAVAVATPYDGDDFKSRTLHGVSAALDMHNMIAHLEMTAENDRSVAAFHLLLSMMDRSPELGFDFEEVLEEVRQFQLENGSVSAPAR